jgi:hypothetical protein
MEKNKQDLTGAITDKGYFATKIKRYDGKFLYPNNKGQVDMDREPEEGDDKGFLIKSLLGDYHSDDLIYYPDATGLVDINKAGLTPDIGAYIKKYKNSSQETVEANLFGVIDVPGDELKRGKKNGK